MIINACFISPGSIFFVTGSYLEAPRISFTGHVRIDVNTRNNVNCNYDTQRPVDPDINEDWNSNGTSEFSFLNCNVTSAHTSGGHVGQIDPVVGASVLTNLNQSYPKLVDLDVDYQLIKSGVYGMNLVLIVNNKVALQATLESNVLAQDVWTRSVCHSKSLSTYSSSKCVSILSNVQWTNASDDSSALSEMKRVSNGSNLSISMVVYFYTRNRASSLYTNFTLGYVVGTIGVARPTEPLNFAGTRLLSYKDAYPVNISISGTDSCNNVHPTPVWMYKAPFTTYKTSTNTTALAVDFSNSIAFDTNGDMRDLGELQLAVENVGRQCTQLIGSPLPYLKPLWNEKGGIVDYIIDETTARLLNSSPLIVVRIDRYVTKTTFDFNQQMNVAAADNKYLLPPCDGKGDIRLQLMLKETQFYIRAMNYYVGRLEFNQIMEVRILVTKYGKTVPNVKVNVMQSNIVIPPQGVEVVQKPNASYTDANGIATFTFKANNISFPRQYSTDKNQTTPWQGCANTATHTLPIDGQVYTFNYSVADNVTYNYDGPFVTDVNEIAILGYSFYTPPPRPYTWKDDIEPVFSQYDHLYGKVMRPIVQLSSFRSVTLPQNLQLIKLAMSLDINHPSYMPVSRDLSSTKRNVILEWLKNPIFNKHSKETPYVDTVPLCSPHKSLAALSLAESFFHPPQCSKHHDGGKNNFLEFSNPGKVDSYFEDIFQSESSSNEKMTEMTDICTLESLKKDLQLAMQLELSTIPPYLTALYSIIEGCNLEIKDLIRSIVMQEMLHLLQATNILIAIGGDPKIDNSSVVPHYPTIGLPGGVLPRLRVSLKKLTLMHVYEVFMGIEVPHNNSVDLPGGEITNNTIGQFYKKINDCIHVLGDSIFLESRVGRQVDWPWPNHTLIGKLYVVTNVSSASDAIKEITEQGEGVSPFDPKQGDLLLSRLAHFYKYEEIVCQRKLIKTEHGGYAYEGRPIPYNPQGVWPMKANPRSADIPLNNNCYTEAKAFHGAYRALLRNLQEIFSGTVNGTTGMKNAVTIMEAMAVHARKLMWTKITPDDDETCGPVWDYDWVESKC